MRHWDPMSGTSGVLFVPRNYLATVLGVGLSVLLCYFLSQKWLLWEVFHASRETRQAPLLCLSFLDMRKGSKATLKAF